MSSPTPARRVAYEVLRRVFEHDAYADRALRAAAARAGLEGRERAQAQRLAYGAVQRRGTSDRIAGRLARRPAGRIDRPLIAALRLGLYELLYSDAAAPHAVVDQAVSLARGERSEVRRQRGAGLVNAVLRRAATEREQLLASLTDDSAKHAAAKHSLPRWIAELWWRERGAERARALMEAANRPPRRPYRINPLRVDPEELVKRLAAAGLAVNRSVGELPLPETLLDVKGGPRGPLEEAIEAGELVPQSAGSALAVGLLAPGEGDRVLDLCAAPGVKTTQIAAAVGAGGRVVAVDRDERRARELEGLCTRAGAGSVEVRVGDGRRLELGSGYDRVLVDAPCSGLGTLASRPDLRWRRQPTDLERLPALQVDLLGAAADALRPGGSLLYSVCTISRTEGAAVVESAVSGRGDLAVTDLGAAYPALADDGDPRFLQLLPDRDDTDGFFFARLDRRRKEARA